MTQADSTFAPGHLTKPQSLIPFPMAVATIGAGVVGLSVAAMPVGWAPAALASGVALLVAGVAGRLQQWWTRHLAQTRIDTVLDMVDGAMAASFLVRGDGRILHRNAAAQASGRGAGEDTLTASVRELFANPGAVTHRMQSAAALAGTAREEIITRRGQVRLTVTRIGDDLFLWQIEENSDRAGAGRGADALGLPMLTAGPSGTVLYMNESFRRLLGARAKTLDRIFDKLPVRSGQVHRVRGAEGPVHCLVAELSGTGGRREIYLLPAAAAGGADGAAAWGSAIDEVPVPVLRLSAGGTVLGANRSARILLGSEITGSASLTDLLEGPGRPLGDIVREVCERRTAQTVEFVRTLGPKPDTVVQLILSPGGGGGASPHVVAVLNDITQLKALEAQFVQSQKMQAIGQLAGGVAHDFNNLLTAISGHCDLMLLRHDQGDPDYGDLVQIHQNANRAAGLVGQLLAFSRKQTLNPEVLNLKTGLSDLTHLLNRLVGEKIRLTLDNEPALLPIRADKRQLEQVLMNLVVNARDAMPDGGEIRIVTENAVLGEALTRDQVSVPPGRYVVLRVIDDGCGIPPEILPTIFDPFVTTKRPGEGTGLGLSTAYGIVKQTGGYIFVDSEVGQGTAFSIYIPAFEGEVSTDVRPPRKATSMPRLAARSVQDDAVVLLVEDEAPVRAFAARALRLRGYTVLEADSAETALTLLADGALRVDLFLTDVIMPGMDGPTWVRQALADRPDTKVVFVSGYTDDPQEVGRGTVKDAAFLPKPFSLNELTEAVQAQLG